MALTPPPKAWSKVALGKDERLWTYLMLIMILMMGLMTVGYVFLGDQNPPEQYFKYDTVEEMFDDFRAGNDASGATVVDLANEVLDEDGNQVQGLSLLDGGDIYLLARQWEWTVPLSSDSGIHAIQLKEGETYNLHIGSMDVLHGFQLIGSDFIVSLQIVPGYDYVLDFVPNETGIFRIICNEFCGSAHHTMLGYMEIVP